MGNYVKNTNFTAKDNLITGDPNKVVRGSEIDNELSAIAVAVNSKSEPTATETLTNKTLTAPTINDPRIAVGGSNGITGQFLTSAGAGVAPTWSTPFGAEGLSGTSTSSNTIGTGSKTFTIETGRGFVAGMTVRIGDTAAPNSNYLEGTVTSYNSTTGVLVVNATATLGSGTFTSWSVRVPSLPSLVTGATITTATTLTAGDANLRSVNMSTASQSVTLPNATQLTAGRQYTFDNIGGREFGIRNSTGQLIARVGANLTVSVYLLDNSTAAGLWAVEGTDALLPLTICDNTFSSTYTAVDAPQCRLTDTLSLHVIRDSGGTRFIVAVDHSTYPATVGTPVSTAQTSTVVDIRRVSNTKAVIALNDLVFNVTVSGTTITLSSSGSMNSSFFLFTGAPTVCNLTDNLIVGIRVNGAAVEARAADLSGANPVVGTAVNIVASGGQNVSAVYRITDTTALVIYSDDSGIAGSPFSLRAVVLTVTGTTISIGTTAGINDVLEDGTLSLPSCQLTTSSYVVSYRQTSTQRPRIVHIGVSGTTVTFGTPLEVEATGTTDAIAYLNNGSNRFQPNLFPLTSTTVLMTYHQGTSGTSCHVVISNSGGTLTAGTILVRGGGSGGNGAYGNFPQRSDRFLVISNFATAQERISAFSINGTSISRVDSEVALSYSSSWPGSRFGLSGNYFGIQGNSSSPAISAWSLFRFSDVNGLQYLGRVVPSNSANVGNTRIPIELASNRVGMIGQKEFENTPPDTSLVSLVILEFPL